MMCGDVRVDVYRALIGDVNKAISKIKGVGTKTLERVEKYIRNVLDKKYADLNELKKELRYIRKEAREKVMDYIAKLHEAGEFEQYVVELEKHNPVGAEIDVINRDGNVKRGTVDFSKYGIGVVGEDGSGSNTAFNGAEKETDNAYIARIETTGKRGHGNLWEVEAGREDKDERDERTHQEGELYVTRGVKEWDYDRAIHPRDIIEGEELYEEQAVKDAKYYAFYRGALKNNFENRGIKKLAGRWDSKKAEEIIKMYRSGADEIDPFVLEAAFDVVAHAKGYDYLLKNYGKELKKFGVQRKRMLESWGMGDDAFKHVKYSENLANDVYKFVKDNKDKIARGAAYGVIAATAVRALEDPDTFLTAVNNLVTGKATYYPHAASALVGGALGGMAGLWAEEKLVKYRDSIKSGASRIWNGLKKKLNKLTSKFERCPLDG